MSKTSKKVSVPAVSGSDTAVAEANSAALANPTNTAVGGRVLIFCFGSNLCFSRFKRRCPSAEMVGHGIMPGAAIRFQGGFVNMVAPDSEGCSHGTFQGQPAVGGAVYSITEGDLPRLDQIEGDFTRKVGQVVLQPSGEVKSCVFYRNEQPNPEKKVTRFHLSFLFQGLLEMCIDPAPYLDAWNKANDNGELHPLHNPADASLNPNAVGNTGGDTQDRDRQREIAERIRLAQGEDDGGSRTIN